MNKRPRLSQRSGAFGLLLVFCLTAFIGGLGFDLGAGARVRFWIGEQPGAAGAVGVAAALFMVLIAHGGRMALNRWRKEAANEGGGDGRTHA